MGAELSKYCLGLGRTEGSGSLILAGQEAKVLAERRKFLEQALEGVLSLETLDAELEPLLASISGDWSVGVTRAAVNTSCNKNDTLYSVCVFATSLNSPVFAAKATKRGDKVRFSSLSREPSSYDASLDFRRVFDCVSPEVTAPLSKEQVKNALRLPYLLNKAWSDMADVSDEHNSAGVITLTPSEAGKKAEIELILERAKKAAGAGDKGPAIHAALLLYSQLPQVATFGNCIQRVLAKMQSDPIPSLVEELKKAETTDSGVVANADDCITQKEFIAAFCRQREAFVKLSTEGPGGAA